MEGLGTREGDGASSRGAGGSCRRYQGMCERRGAQGVDRSNGCLQLLTGTAEVFGTEMARNQTYSLCPRLKVAIFTWHGCTVRVEGEPQVIYVSEETPMVMYLNSHIAIDQLRHRREQEGKTGPRVSPSPSLSPPLSLSLSLPTSLPSSLEFIAVCVFRCCLLELQMSVRAHCAGYCSAMQQGWAASRVWWTVMWAKDQSQYLALYVGSSLTAWPDLCLYCVCVCAQVFCQWRDQLISRRGSSTNRHLWCMPMALPVQPLISSCTRPWCPAWHTCSRRDARQSQQVRASEGTPLIRWY